MLVITFPSPFPSTSGQHVSVRLVNNVTSGPGSQYEGRVEVHWNGQWGSICSVGWDWEDANVICTMAGFETAVRPVTDGFYGPGVLLTSTYLYIQSPPTHPLPHLKNMLHMIGGLSCCMPLFYI